MSDVQLEARITTAIKRGAQIVAPLNGREFLVIRIQPGRLLARDFSGDTLYPESFTKAVARLIVARVAAGAGLQIEDEEVDRE